MSIAEIPDNPLDTEAFRAAMRLTASGVSVITTSGPAGQAGLTVSSLSSLSLEPPSVLVCIHRGNRALPVLLENGNFGANVLASNQSEIADVFAGMVPEKKDSRFSVGDWTFLAGGSPFLRNARCAFDCELVQTHEFGSHVILIGSVRQVFDNDAEVEPLIYANREYRQLGPVPEC